MTPEELRSAGLLYEVTGAVAVVTLDRPEVRNAQTPAMWHALAAIGEQIADDVRVVVVRGSGQTFSAGLDRAMLDPGAGDGVETVAALLAQSDEEASAAIERSSAASPGCATRASCRSRPCRGTPSAPASSSRSRATCGCWPTTPSSA